MFIFLQSLLQVRGGNWRILEWFPKNIWARIHSEIFELKLAVMFGWYQETPSSVPGTLLRRHIASEKVILLTNILMMKRGKEWHAKQQLMFATTSRTHPKIVQWLMSVEKERKIVDCVIKQLHEYILTPADHHHVLTHANASANKQSNLQKKEKLKCLHWEC